MIIRVSAITLLTGKEIKGKGNTKSLKFEKTLKRMLESPPKENKPLNAKKKEKENERNQK